MHNRPVAPASSRQHTDSILMSLLFLSRPFLRALCVLSVSALSLCSSMSFTIRPYDPHDFSALYKLDQSCFVPGISYSKWTLQYFLNLPSADCLVAVDDHSHRIAGFILTEENPPLAHIITLDTAESHRRKGLGSALLAAMEKELQLHGVHSILLETSVENSAAIAFWQRHGYTAEATIKRYYLGRIDAHEMRKRLPHQKST
jgi:[ribosomal protein S18]-alanine N-acetyltransferase